MKKSVWRMVKLSNAQDVSGRFIFGGFSNTQDPFRVSRGYVANADGRVITKVDYVGDIGQNWAQISDNAFAPLLFQERCGNPGSPAGLGDAFRNILGPLKGPGDKHTLPAGGQRGIGLGLAEIVGVQLDAGDLGKFLGPGRRIQAHGEYHHVKGLE